MLITDFRAGEVTPQLAMRVDSKAYPSGASSLRNCIIANTGSVARRPGTKHLTSMATRRRLIGYEYDEDEKYILAFGNNALAIYNSTGTSVTTFSGTTDCPWVTANFLEMTFASAGDVIIICHREFKTKILKRTSLTTFTMTSFAFDQAPNVAEIYQPYIKYELASVTLALSSTAAGSVTVTASSAIFSSAWVNDTIRIHGVELTITAYTSTTVVTATAKKIIESRLDPTPFLYTDGDDTIEVTHAFHGMASGVSVTIAGATDEYSISRSNINGARTITVIDEDHYTFDTGAADAADTSADGGATAVKINSTAATRDWDEQAFSTRRGWPGAVCFHEDRLWFGGITSVQDGIWSSHTGEYFNFSVGEGIDSESIQISIGSTRIANIRHIVSNRVLQVFTEGGEFVAKQSDGAALTPATVSIRSQTSYGSSYLRPKPFDGATLFLQANQKTVREFLFDFNQDGFQAADLTALSSHLISQPIAFDVFYGSTTRPEQYALFVNGDGTLSVFHSVRAESLAAWTPWETKSGDVFDSVCVLGNNAYVSALRGGTYYLEQIMFDTETTLDASKAMTAASTVTWALGSRYASLTVHVVSNDHYLGTYVANGSGTITLDDAVTSITAGFNYTWEVTPLPPDIQVEDGPLTGVVRRVVSATVHMYETLSLSVNGREIPMREVGQDFSIAPDRRNEKMKAYIMGYNRDPVVELTQSSPLPVTILGLVMEVSF